MKENRAYHAHLRSIIDSYKPGEQFTLVEIQKKLPAEHRRKVLSISACLKTRKLASIAVPKGAEVRSSLWVRTMPRSALAPTAEAGYGEATGIVNTAGSSDTFLSSPSGYNDLAPMLQRIKDETFRIVSALPPNSTFTIKGLIRELTALLRPIFEVKFRHVGATIRDNKLAWALYRRSDVTGEALWRRAMAKPCPSCATVYIGGHSPHCGAVMCDECHLPVPEHQPDCPQRKEPFVSGGQSGPARPSTPLNFGEPLTPLARPARSLTHTTATVEIAKGRSITITGDATCVGEMLKAWQNWVDFLATERR